MLKRDELLTANGAADFQSDFSIYLSDFLSNSPDINQVGYFRSNAAVTNQTVPFILFLEESLHSDLLSTRLYGCLPESFYNRTTLYAYQTLLWFGYLFISRVASVYRLLAIVVALGAINHLLMSMSPVLCIAHGIQVMSNGIQDAFLHSMIMPRCAVLNNMISSLSVTRPRWLSVQQAHLSTLAQRLNKIVVI